MGGYRVLGWIIGILAVAGIILVSRGCAAHIPCSFYSQSSIRDVPARCYSTFNK